MFKNRASISLLFFLCGINFASWATRIPDFKEKLHLTDSELGTILLGLPIGSLISLPLAGWLITKYESKWICLTAIVMYIFIMPILGYSPNSLGLFIGLFAASAKSRTDSFIMRFNDILLAFPQIVFVLLVVSGFGSSIFLIAVTVGLTHAPRTARIIRAAAAEVMERDFIKAAIAVGEKRHRIIFSELLPNVTSSLLVEFGLRMTYSIGLVAAVSFLGLGLQPPAADWGLMINENRGSMTVQPWAVLTPIFAIAIFTIGINFITDSFAKVAIGIDRKGKE